MIRWRRRNEGFEWREYVRTTILVRRKERRQRIRNIRAAAAEKVRNAGRVCLQGSVKCATWIGKGLASLSMTALLRAARSVQAARSAVASLARSSRPMLESAAREVIQSLPARLAPLQHFLSQPYVRLPVLIIGAASGLSALQRFYFSGVDANAVAGALIAFSAAALLFATRPTRRNVSSSTSLERLLGRWAPSLEQSPGLDRLGRRRASGTLFVAVAILAGAGAWWFLADSEAPSHPIAASGSALDISSPLEGRAVATAGDRLKIDGVTVKLEGVEAPEPEQTCDGPNGTWRCGAIAKEALARAVRGQRVYCQITGRDDLGLPTARCAISGNDIAAPLVQSGYLFAEPGLFTRYGGEEYEAMLAKAGIWSGAPMRPADFRAKLWQNAALRAPGGCPIKGRIMSGVRVYVLPWSPLYGKVRVNTARGERWFCSEREAEAAGWKPQPEPGS